MGNIFHKKRNDKHEYYILLQIEKKKLYDKNRYSTFNQAYSLQTTKFNTRRQSTKLFMNENNEIDFNWKNYLLEKFSPNPNDNLRWKFSFYDYIINENFPNQYIFQNKIFFEEFSLITKPKSDKKEEDLLSLKSEPILSSLDSKELKSLSRSLPSICLNRSLNDPDYNISEINININTNEKNQVIDNDYDQHLIMDVSMESIDSTMVKQDPKYEAQLNSLKIRKYIQIIKKHLDNKQHPINVIIHKFIGYFTPYLDEATKYCEKMKENKKECMNKGKEIIKEIQYFIETMQVVVKLFYSKSVNYRYFIDEKDEIINLISYILFNKQTIYKKLFTIFRFMNFDNIERLSSQFQKIGDLTPSDLGIQPKFCLDKTTDEFIKKLKDNKNNNKANEDIKIQENRLSKKISKLAQFFESHNIKESKNVIIDDIDINDYDDNVEKQRDNLTESNFPKKSSKYKSLLLNDNDNDDDDDISGFKMQDFKKDIDSYQENMKIKDILLDKIENKYFPSLPKMPKYNDIPSSNEPYQLAINYLSQIDSYKVPLEKLTVIALISVIITNCVDKYWESMQKDLSAKFLNIDADSLMPIYCYIIYKLKLPSLYIHLDFIKYFTTVITKQSMIGYYYITLEGCLNYILSIKDKESLLKNGI